MQLCEISNTVFFHVIPCHENDLNFKTQIYEEIKAISRILALFC